MQYNLILKNIPQSEDEFAIQSNAYTILVL